MIKDRTLTVAQWMTPNPRTISPETPVLEASKLMRDGGFRRLPVVENGQLMGIVTDRDLKEAMPSDATTLSVWELNYLIAKLKVREVMSRPVLTIEATAPLEEAARKLLEHKVGGLVVVDGDQVKGILTITDVLKAFVNAPL